MTLNKFRDLIAFLLSTAVTAAAAFVVRSFVHPISLPNTGDDNERNFKFYVWLQAWWNIGRVTIFNLCCIWFVAGSLHSWYVCRCTKADKWAREHDWTNKRWRETETSIATQKERKSFSIYMPYLLSFSSFIVSTISVQRWSLRSGIWAI